MFAQFEFRLNLRGGVLRERKSEPITAQRVVTETISIFRDFSLSCSRALKYSEVKATSQIDYQLALFLEADGFVFLHIDDHLIDHHVSSENVASDREA